MRPNIDLTENRDFAKNALSINNAIIDGRNTRRTISNLNRLLGNASYPWNQVIYRMSRFDETELVFTGNKQDILRKKHLSVYEEGYTCERCGTDISNKPWNRTWGLCNNCDDILESESNRSNVFSLRF